MRFTVLVLLLSSFVFAQDAGQQAAQIAIQQTQQANQQAVIQFSQWQNEASLRTSQQMIDNAAAINRNLQWNVTHAPKFWPKPGTFKGTAPNVTITDPTKGAVIYFTTDGATPTLKSQRYTGPIALAATTTVKAMAVAPASGQSPTAKGKYVVK